MPKYIYSCDGMTLIRIETDTPVCGQHYCDRCGECLNCGGEICTNGGDHWWVVYDCGSTQVEGELTDAQS